MDDGDSSVIWSQRPGASAVIELSKLETIETLFEMEGRIRSLRLILPGRPYFPTLLEDTAM